MVRIISEPVAASLGYGLDKVHQDNLKKILEVFIPRMGDILLPIIEHKMPTQMEIYKKISISQSYWNIFHINEHYNPKGNCLSVAYFIMLQNVIMLV